jgi:predicted PurR-regulated permease PerM
LLIGFLVFVTAFIPLVGSVPVTVSTAGILLLTGHLTAGVFLSIMAVIVALIDNLARPFVLKGASNLHPLLAFAGALGGIQTMGFAGVFLGPILVGLAAVWIKRATA